MVDPIAKSRRRRRNQQRRLQRHGIVARLVVAALFAALTSLSSRRSFDHSGGSVARAFSSTTPPTSSAPPLRRRRWRIRPPFSPASSSSPSSPPPPRNDNVVVLRGGYGVAGDSYSWKEDQFELEVIVGVPPRTSASNVRFRCTSGSIDLRLILPPASSDDDDGGGGGGEERVLLDGSRKTRGTMCVDGTHWSIDGDGESRVITIAIEKHFVPTSANMREGSVTYDASTVFDWGGVYPDDGVEVTRREYGEAEELDVREYAMKLGVDIDNIDMSKVNKTMFGAGTMAKDADDASVDVDDDAGRGRRGDDDRGVNYDGMNNDGGFRFDIDQATLERLARAGLAKEVVRQADGSEYELGGEERTLFSMLGKDISDDELREAGIVGGVGVTPKKRAYYDAGDDVRIEADEVRVITSNAGVVDVPVTSVVEEEEEENVDISGDDASMKRRDPIDMLTVARLKEVLKSQGLKTSGTKGVLRDRLRGHVTSMLREE